MRFTLLRYLSLEILKWISITFAGLLFFTFLVNTLEQVRRLFGTTKINFWLELKIGLFDLPVYAELIFPFAIFFGALIAFLYLSRYHEIITLRAAGLSLIQLMKPCIILGLSLGLLHIFCLNPLSLFFGERHDRIVKSYSDDKSTDVELGQNGFWIRVRTQEGYQIIHAASLVPPSISLNHVYFLNFDKNNQLINRIDGSSATLDGKKWRIHQAIITEWKNLEQTSTRYPQYELETHLEHKHILNAIAQPGKTPFFKLFALISKFKQQGFPTEIHELHVHKFMSLPFMYIAYLIIALICSLYIPRLGANFTGAALGAVICFALYLGDKIFFSFGANHGLPVLFSAWTPPLVAILFAFSGLIHREDV